MASVADATAPPGSPTTTSPLAQADDGSTNPFVAPQSPKHARSHSASRQNSTGAAPSRASSGDGTLGLGGLGDAFGSMSVSGGGAAKGFGVVGADDTLRKENGSSRNVRPTVTSPCPSLTRMRAKRHR